MTELFHHNNVLFIHIPKTGGSSMVEYLNALLPVPNGHRSGTFRVPYTPDKHATVQHILDPTVVTIFRNPYDRMVSLYHWYKTLDLDSEKISAAVNNDFAGFCAYALNRQPKIPDFCDYADMLRLRNEIYPKKVIFMFEQMPDIFPKIARVFGLDPTEYAPWRIPHLNKSKDRKPWQDYMTQPIEAIIYALHKWTFDNKFYERWKG